MVVYIYDFFKLYKNLNNVQMRLAIIDFSQLIKNKKVSNNSEIFVLIEHLNCFVFRLTYIKVNAFLSKVCFFNEYYLLLALSFTNTIS